MPPRSRLLIWWEVRVRCQFMRDGHIGAVVMLTDASGAAAITQARAPFGQRTAKLAGSEVWDRACFVHRYRHRSRRHEGER